MEVVNLCKEWELPEWQQVNESLEDRCRILEMSENVSEKGQYREKFNPTFDQRACHVNNRVISAMGQRQSEREPDVSIGNLSQEENRCQENFQNDQRMVWRENTPQPVPHYELTRLTFDTSPAPYPTVRTLREVARNGVEKQSDKDIILNDCYMHDLLSGCHKEAELGQRQVDVSQILLKGGLKLHKWRSNNETLLRENLKAEHTEIDPTVFNQINSLKVLGVGWNQKGYIYVRVSLYSPTNNFATNEAQGLVRGRESI